MISLRCPSGIDGFDELCEGGYIRGSVNSIVGGPGSGKTIFSLQFLKNGVKNYEDNGLYISFEPNIKEIHKDTIRFGWNIEELEKRNRIKMIKVEPYTKVIDIKRILTKLISNYDIKRVCFDPINLFGAIENNEAKRRVMIIDIISLLKKFDITTLLATESSNKGLEQQQIVLKEDRSEYIKFLSDSYIELHSSGLGGISDRAIRIIKMRGTNHIRGPISMTITEKGIVVFSKKKNSKKIK